MEISILCNETKIKCYIEDYFPVIILLEIVRLEWVIKNVANF